MKHRGSLQREPRFVVLRLACVLAVAVSSSACSLRALVNDGAAIAAKTLCSGVYVAHRDFEDVLEQDVRPISPVMRNLHAVRAPGEEVVGARLTVPVIGSAERVAHYRPGLGCVLEPPTPGAPVPAAFGPSAEAAQSDGVSGEWPNGEAVDEHDIPSTVRSELLRSAIDHAFTGGDGRPSLETRAIVIVHRGRIIAERYAAGFGPATPLPGWSMAKSVLNALIGIRVHEGRLALDAHDLYPAWNRPGDARSKITIGDLLYARSGLRFDENYGPGSDVRQMLFNEADMAGFAASQPLEHGVGTRWAYSSGTSNILSWVLRRSFESDEEYWRFPRRALFGPLGMRSAVIEADASGTFVASSYLYASARDWARFGLLYLNDGVWNGVRILPHGWVRRSTAPAPGSSGAQAYGMQWWLVLSDANVPLGREPALPAGSFFARGHWGQHIAVVPSHDLVVVRLGWTIDESGWDPAAFTARVVEAVRQ